MPAAMETTVWLSVSTGRTSDRTCHSKRQHHKRHHHNTSSPRRESGCKVQGCGGIGEGGERGGPASMHSVWHHPAATHALLDIWILPMPRSYTCRAPTPCSRTLAAAYIAPVRGCWCIAAGKGVAPSCGPASSSSPSCSCRSSCAPRTCATCCGLTEMKRTSQFLVTYTCGVRGAGRGGGQLRRRRRRHRRACCSPALLHGGHAPACSATPCRHLANAQHVKLPMGPPLPASPPPPSPPHLPAGCTTRPSIQAQELPEAATHMLAHSEGVGQQRMHRMQLINCHGKCHSRRMACDAAPGPGAPPSWLPHSRPGWTRRAQPQSRGTGLCGPGWGRCTRSCPP